MAARSDEDDLEEQLAQFEREIQQVSTKTSIDSKPLSSSVSPRQPSTSFTGKVSPNQEHCSTSAPPSTLQNAVLGVRSNSVAKNNPLPAPHVATSVARTARLAEPPFHYSEQQWRQDEKAWQWVSSNNAVSPDTKYVAPSATMPPHVHVGPLVAAPNLTSPPVFMPTSAHMPLSVSSGVLLPSSLHGPVPMPMTSNEATLLSTPGPLIATATAGSVPHLEPTSVSNTEEETGADEAAKQKVAKRTAAGQVWHDPTLTDWPENDHRLFVGDLGPDATDVELSQAFSKYPSFNMARVVKDKRTSACRGYGFVSFATAADMLAAIKEMDGKYVGSRPVKLRRSSWQKRSLTKDKWKQVHDFRAISKRHRKR